LGFFEPIGRRRKRGVEASINAQWTSLRYGRSHFLERSAFIPHPLASGHPPWLPSPGDRLSSLLPCSCSSSRPSPMQSLPREPRTRRSPRFSTAGSRGARGRPDRSGARARRGRERAPAWRRKVPRASSRTSLASAGSGARWTLRSVPRWRRTFHSMTCPVAVLASLTTNTHIGPNSAVRKMKTLTTAQGRKIYGSKFWNIDDMTLLHACSTLDPRCDQGHYGPQFMSTFQACLPGTHLVHLITLNLSSLVATSLPSSVSAAIRELLACSRPND
jgi:hypothetical protein